MPDYGLVGPVGMNVNVNLRTLLIMCKSEHCRREERSLPPKDQFAATVSS